MINNFTLRQSCPWFFMFSPCCAPAAEVSHQPVAAASTQPRTYGHEAKAQPPWLLPLHLKPSQQPFWDSPHCKWTALRRAPARLPSKPQRSCTSHTHTETLAKKTGWDSFCHSWLQQWPAPNLNTSGSQNTPSIGSKTVKAKNANEKADIFQPPKS